MVWLGLALGMPDAGGDDWHWHRLGGPGLPQRYSGHSLIWTGRELILWGGRESERIYRPVNTGSRYDFQTRTWMPTSQDGAPSPRSYHSAVWTGRQMVIWGGQDYGGEPYGLRNGARYDPDTDRWQPISQEDAPLARDGYSTVWTGQEMIVWGGVKIHDYTRTGARYDPDSDRWQPLPVPADLTGRWRHSAVWTGSEMIVWGGERFEAQSSYELKRVVLRDGARFDPLSGEWHALSTLDAPAARSLHAAVWTGTEMIVWGGQYLNTILQTGDRYDLSEDLWTGRLSTTNAPATLESPRAFWTGQEVIVWDGIAGRSGRYRPLTDTWTAFTTNQAPVQGGAAVWTDHGLMVFERASTSGLSLYHSPSVAPFLIEPPRPRSAILGTRLEWSVRAEGEEPLVFQWQRDGIPLPDASNATLAVEAVLPEHAGNYTVTVRNAAGAVTSAPVLLTVRCGYVVAPRRLTFREAGGIASIRIRAYRDCAWEVRNTNAWVEIPPEDWSGRGDREVLLAVQALAGRSARTGILTVGDEVVTIIQSPPETVPPSVSVAYPRAGARLSDPSLLFQGQARDNTGIEQVFVQLGSNAVLVAEGVSPWTLSLNLVPGTNTIRAWAVDIAGNVSAAVSRSVFFVCPSPFKLEVLGQGTVTPDVAGENLEIGKAYTLLARPARGQLFAGWSGDEVSSDVRLTFLMRSNLTLQARFVPNPFPPLQGVYYGLFREAEDVRLHRAGFCRVLVTARGQCVAQLRCGPTRVRLRGQFGLDGSASMTGTAPDGQSLAAQLQIDLEHGEDPMIGQVQDGSWTAELLAHRPAFDGVTAPAPWSGQYTLVLLSDPDASSSPGGHGFARVTVDPSGWVRWVGRAGDGSPVVLRGPVSLEGRCPIYASLYGREGFLLGWVEFGDLRPGALSGTLHWIKPAGAAGAFYASGFTNQLQVLGSPYQPPGEGDQVVGWSQGQVSLTSQPGGSGENFMLAWEGQHQLESAGLPGLRLVVQPKTGQFFGTFQPAPPLSISRVRGIFLQSSETGWGYFTHPEGTGAVWIGPGE